MDFLFVLNSILLGVGLAMDAFSVSLANGLGEPAMKKRKLLLIAGTFAFFQALMPLIGWFFVHYLVGVFSWLSPAIPYCALALLLFIGGKMLFDALRDKSGGEDLGEYAGLTFPTLLLQGIATSIDALSVGFTIEEYDALLALAAALIIAAVTFVICVGGVLIGRKFGTKLAGKASLVGGVILILIGLEIFITGVFF